MSDEKRAGFTPGPWRWIEAEQNERIRRITGKPRSRLAKKDGLWLYLLVSEDGRYQGPDPDPWDFKHIMGMRWSTVRGDSTLNATPSKSDAALIASAPDLYAALAGPWTTTPPAPDDYGYTLVPTHVLQDALARARGEGASDEG